MAARLTEHGIAARLKSDRAVNQAKRLRAEMTKSERAVWSILSALRPTGLHFRKQAPIGPFIVDFVCHKQRLIIEIDGGVHNAPDVQLRDAKRQEWLEGRGYTVFRASAKDAERDPDAVVVAALQRVGVFTPHP